MITLSDLVNTVTESFIKNELENRIQTLHVDEKFVCSGCHKNTHLNRNVNSTCASKREVPRGVRNSKVRRQDKFRRDWSRH